MPPLGMGKLDCVSLLRLMLVSEEEEIEMACVTGEDFIFQGIAREVPDRIHTMDLLA